MSIEGGPFATGAAGQNPASLIKVVGSFINPIAFHVDGAEGSNAGPAVTMTFPQLTFITGFVVQARVTASGLDESDEFTATASGNVLTITEVVAGDSELATYDGFVWGPAKML